ncbi:MAG: hypothetical protein FWG62_01855 [Proteobacteria bacterium]|nr:hypothetical protein [Pseudomonadota bacterium]
MGLDGTKACGPSKAKENPCYCGQAACVVYGMPKTPAELRLTDVVAPPDRIAAEIIWSVKSWPSGNDGAHAENTYGGNQTLLPIYSRYFRNIS